MQSFLKYASSLRRTLPMDMDGEVQVLPKCFVPANRFMPTLHV
jgi:hypothetical protein